jgi:alkyl hydroperoxide reductase subunit AhpC
VFVIGPDKKIKLVLVYPTTTGRNIDEVLRVIDSLQLTALHRVATPVNWKQGEDVIIAAPSQTTRRGRSSATGRHPSRTSGSCPCRERDTVTS